MTEPTRYYQTNVVLNSNRGNFPYKNPTILERRAGFYPRKDDRRFDAFSESCYPRHFFAAAPSTRFPPRAVKIFPVK